MVIRVRKWIFTLNNYIDTDIEKLKNNELFQYICFGKEIAPSTNTPHLQGFLITKKKITLNSLKKKLGLSNSIFLDRMKSDEKSCIEYCKKEGNFYEEGIIDTPGKRNDIHNIYKLIKENKTDYEIQEEDPLGYSKYYKAIDRMRSNIINNKNIEEIRKTFNKVILKVWQEDVLELLFNQDERKVLWIYDRLGNNGKSFLSKYLLVKYNAFLITNGKSQDIAYSYKYQNIVVFDFSRSLEDYVNYQVIEQFKDGRLFSSKYESTMKHFPSCKVIIMSNFLPDTSKLSQDRWKIVVLENYKRELK